MCSQAKTPHLQNPLRNHRQLQPASEHRQTPTKQRQREPTVPATWPALRRLGHRLLVLLTQQPHELSNPTGQVHRLPVQAHRAQASLHRSHRAQPQLLDQLGFKRLFPGSRRLERPNQRWVIEQLAIEN